MKKQIKSTPTRRDFIATGAAVLGFNIIPRHVLGAPGQPPPSEKLNIGCVGIGGQGGGGRPDMAQAGGPDGGRAKEALSAVETLLRDRVKAA